MKSLIKRQRAVCNDEQDWRRRRSPPLHCSSEIDQLPTRLCVPFLAVSSTLTSLSETSRQLSMGHKERVCHSTTTTTTTDRSHRITLVLTAILGPCASRPPPITALTYADEFPSRVKAISPSHAYDTVNMLRRVLYGSKNYKLYRLDNTVLRYKIRDGYQSPPEKRKRRKRPHC